MAILKLKKVTFYRHRTPIFLGVVDIDRDIEKVSFGENNYKYFIGYFYYNDKVKLLHIMLSKTSAYVKSYDGRTTWMYFLIEDEYYKYYLG